MADWKTTARKFYNHHQSQTTAPDGLLCALALNPGWMVGSSGLLLLGSQKGGQKTHFFLAGEKIPSTPCRLNGWW